MIQPGRYGGVDLDAEQCQNVEIIWEVTGAVGIQPKRRAFMVAVITAHVESWIRSLNWGDKDSLGMFQQKPFWGTRTARLDPRQTTRTFLLGGWRLTAGQNPG